MVEATVGVIVAHPDDEVLLAGGTIARHAMAGDIVHVLILATGAAARGGDQSGYVEQLRGQAQRAAKVLGATSVNFRDFPDNRMDTVPLLEVIQSVEAFLEEKPAATVYTHHFGDLNVDHRVTGEAVLTACRPLPGSSARKIYCGETLSSTEWTTGSARFAPTTFFDVAGFIDRKIEALACYEAELRNFPHPRSAAAVRALAAIRGAESGLEAAEAFALIRHVQR